jgi:hypothetical protein
MGCDVKPRWTFLTKWRPAGSLTFADCYPSSWQRVPSQLTPTPFTAQYDRDIRSLNQETTMFTIVVALAALFAGGFLGYRYGAKVQADLLTTHTQASANVAHSAAAVAAAGAAVAQAKPAPVTPAAK